MVFSSIIVNSTVMSNDHDINGVPQTPSNMITMDKNSETNEKTPFIQEPSTASTAHGHSPLEEPLFGQELFRLVDNDGDGSLSAEEFVQAMALPSVQQYLKFLEPRHGNVRAVKERGWRDVNM